ncbi:hypothetical protein PXJ20_16355 [Paraburkholderia sp. A1RI_3L]|uniref:hypothetical protein n=1 Tax=Paraburkholderia TaxID=1822464 RepID=UPI003B774812
MNGPKSSAWDAAERPTYEPVRLKEGSGYIVRITWSDGFENEIDGFADEAEVRDWIGSNSADWHELASHRVQLKC